MDRGCWSIHLILLCVWCSLDTSPLIKVNAQIVTLVELNPTGDIIEGDTVQLKCYAYNLSVGYVIEWTRLVLNSDVIISTNGTSFESRYMFNTQRLSTSVIDVLTISNISKEDIGEYTCRVKDSEGINGNIVVQRSLYLKVYYFPSAMYPICFPNGPFTVQEGTTQHMNCTSEIGNPLVHIQIMPCPATAIYPWMYLTIDNEVKGSFNLTVSETDNDNYFECKITSSPPSFFPGREQSCIIGPITVVKMTTENPDGATTPVQDKNTLITKDFVRSSDQTDGLTTTSPTSQTETPLPIAIIAGAAGGGGFVLLLLIIIIVLYVCKCGCFKEKKHKSLQSQTNLPLFKPIDLSMDKILKGETIDTNPDETVCPLSGPETQADTPTSATVTISGEAVIYGLPIPQKSSTCALQLENKQEASNFQGSVSNVGTWNGDPKHDGQQDSVKYTDDGDDQLTKTKMKSQLNEKINDIIRITEKQNLNSPSDPKGYAKITGPLMRDSHPGLKPTAMIKPVPHTAKSTNENQSSMVSHVDRSPPDDGNTQNIKKFTPHQSQSESTLRTGDPKQGQSLPPPRAPPPSPSSSTAPHKLPTSQEVIYSEVSVDHQVPHEVPLSDQITYAELDLPADASDTLPQPKEPTLYASIIMK